MLEAGGTGTYTQRAIPDLKSAILVLLAPGDSTYYRIRPRSRSICRLARWFCNSVSRSSLKNRLVYLVGDVDAAKRTNATSSRRIYAAATRGVRSLGRVHIAHKVHQAILQGRSRHGVAKPAGKTANAAGPRPYAVVSGVARC